MRFIQWRKSVNTKSRCAKLTFIELETDSRGGAGGRDTWAQSHPQRGGNQSSPKLGWRNKEVHSSSVGCRCWALACSSLQAFRGNLSHRRHRGIELSHSDSQPRTAAAAAGWKKCSQKCNAIVKCEHNALFFYLFFFLPVILYSAYTVPQSEMHY